MGCAREGVEDTKVSEVLQEKSVAALIKVFKLKGDCKGLEVLAFL